MQLRISALYWDDENIEHIVRHQVTPGEVEDVCFGRGLVARGRHGRYLIYGQTSAGRYLLVVLNSLGEGRFRPITARELTGSEKESYRRRMSR